MVNINKVYNFSTLAPAIIGSDFKDMKVRAILTAEEAVKYRDIQTLHNTLKPIITALPTSVNDCSYVLFENIDNEKVLLALEYIDMFSIQEVVSTNIRVEIYNTNTDDVSIIRNRFIELGYANVKVTTF
ncbi:MAG: phage DNA polymerase-associated SH3 family protein [Arcobacter sp.]